MRTAIIVAAIGVALLLGNTIKPAPVDGGTYNCTYGNLSTATLPGQDMFLSVSNTSGTTMAIRHRLYRSGGALTAQTWLNVPSGSTRYINQRGYYIVVEYKRADWSAYRFGCERFG